jgi:putative FmdB family regulatory protein
MPVYEYGCAGCGTEFERYVSGPGTVVACPRCESSKVTRRLSLVGVRTGGSGMASGTGMGSGCCGGGCGCH